jgi:hypothetical protein
VLACLACTAACGFHSAAGPVDASASDGPEVALDAAIDAAPLPPDARPPSRARDGLVGLWTFDEPAGTAVTTTAADTASAGAPVPLKVVFGTVSYAGGAMTPGDLAVVTSDPAPHLNTDVVRGFAVTLEAWVRTDRADQGTASAPAMVAGLSASIVSRNISLLQIGTHWVARVRTTADKNGQPDLTSSAEIVPDHLTHLVVVADATQRVLYVDGEVAFADPVAGAPRSWDTSYRMLLGNELSGNRQWAGSFALVAVYARALSKPQIDTNFALGPDGP